MDKPRDLSEQSLLDRCIWLTRPAGQNDALAQQLRALGARVVELPLLQIRACEPDGATRQRLQNLDNYELLFFISSNAAQIGLAIIADWWPQFPVGLQLFAVGPTTAAVIAEQGLPVHFPTEGMNSEALLALPQLQDIRGKKALIVRGVGGRELLATALRERGAQVDYAELYVRDCPPYEQDYLEQLLDVAPDAIVVSSGEAIEHLRALFEPCDMGWRELPLLLSSPRLLQHAQAQGFARCLSMSGATDVAIIEALCFHLAGIGGQASGRL